MVIMLETEHGKQVKTVFNKRMFEHQVFYEGDQWTEEEMNQYLFEVRTKPDKVRYEALRRR